MERHNCKLCLKSFSNSRVLSAHMRSHMLNLTVHPKHADDDDRDHDHSHNHNPTLQVSELVSSSDEEADGADDEKGFYHGLRENLKQSVRLVDPELCFAIDAASVVLQDRESETESSKNPTRRRSKRARKLFERHQCYPQDEQVNDKSITTKPKFSKLSKYKKPKAWVEPEPVSSISETATEEDVAFCLMMLSRDKWKRKEKQDHRKEREQDYKEQEDEASMDETDESEEFKSSKTTIRGEYRCETCNKVFKSYQALGGHRASHKKLKLLNPIEGPRLQTGKFNSTNNVVSSSSVAVKKIHECPYCYRVFSSGQALGGHKRSHGVSGTAEAAKTTTKKIENLNLLDLNLPAPVEEDDVSQVELSAVSDAEFVNHVKR